MIASDALNEQHEESASENEQINKDIDKAVGAGKAVLGGMVGVFGKFQSPASFPNKRYLGFKLKVKREEKIFRQSSRMAREEGKQSFTMPLKVLLLKNLALASSCIMYNI